VYSSDCLDSCKLVTQYGAVSGSLHPSSWYLQTLTEGTRNLLLHIIIVLTHIAASQAPAPTLLRALSLSQWACAHTQHYCSPTLLRGLSATVVGLRPHTTPPTLLWGSRPQLLIHYRNRNRTLRAYGSRIAANHDPQLQAALPLRSARQGKTLHSPKPWRRDTQVNTAQNPSTPSGVRHGKNLEPQMNTLAPYWGQSKLLTAPSRAVGPLPPAPSRAVGPLPPDCPQA
jgi:hypothetical protein